MLQKSPWWSIRANRKENSRSLPRRSCKQTDDNNKLRRIERRKKFICKINIRTNEIIPSISYPYKYWHWQIHRRICRYKIYINRKNGIWRRWVKMSRKTNKWGHCVLLIVRQTYFMWMETLSKILYAVRWWRFLIYTRNNNIQWS
jgi:hypothetical protein